MLIRFQAAADFNHNILAAVVRRGPEADFRSATAAGLLGLSDPRGGPTAVNTRDVASVAYRALALWLGASGLMALGETLLTWKAMWAQSQAAMAGVSNPMTERGFSGIEPAIS